MLLFLIQNSLSPLGPMREKYRASDLSSHGSDDGHVDRERERDRDIDRERARDRERDREKDRDRERERDRDRERHVNGEFEADDYKYYFDSMAFIVHQRTNVK